MIADYRDHDIAHREKAKHDMAQIRFVDDPRHS